MGEGFGARFFGKIGVGLIVLAFVDLAFVNYWIFKNKPKEEILPQVVVNRAEKAPSPTPTASPSPLVSPSPPPAGGFKTEVKNIETKTIVEKQIQTIVQNAQKEVYIPMGSAYANSDSFSDITSTDVTIDTAKYTAIDYVEFEGSIWVEGGNGRAYTQIKNVSDNNPIIESQISGNSPTEQVRTSAHIPFPNGNKTYRIQLKTVLTNFAAHVENARIKITLK